MPPAVSKFRKLSRSSSHRQALLRNLVTSLIDHESIATTWPKAKEAQRVAEKLITLGKRNTQAARNKAQSYLYNPYLYMEKIFGPLRERYQDRPGGYTRVLRIEPKKDDQAPSAILELVDGPKDIRFAMTARTLLKMREDNKGMNEITSLNVHKVTRYRANGEEDLEKEVKRLEALKIREQKAASKEGNANSDAVEEAEEEDDSAWVDEAVVEKIRPQVPPSLLRRRKNSPASKMPTRLELQEESAEQRPPRHIRRKLERENKQNESKAAA